MHKDSWETHLWILEFQGLYETKNIFVQSINQDVARISLHFFARFIGSYSRLQVQLYFSTSVLQAHQRELDGLQRLLDDRDERLKVIQKESNQLMNAQQTIEEDNQWDWVVRDWMDV